MIVIASDFDGTITKKDSLYDFFDTYASKNWLEVEKLWQEGQISSKECLIKEFELVDNLSSKLIEEYVKTIEIDEGFKDFCRFCKEKNIALYVVSDGVDYFINKILENNKIENLKVITNHGEFIEGKFKLTFPNCYSNCKNDSGTCKCKVIEDLKKKYDKLIYIGDGTSDFCVSKRADYLFAKSGLIKYCKNQNIEFEPFNNFKDIVSKVNGLID